MNQGLLIKTFLWLAILTATPGLAAADKPVLVHYMPWFVAKPYSQVWGWHWTMKNCQPELTNAAGTPQIASHYCPEIGPYDSADPAVLEYHVLLMKLAGIDGVIADWYGPEAVNDYAMIDARTSALLGFTRRAGLKFCLCYEDRSVQAGAGAGGPATTAIARAQRTLRYAQDHYFIDPGYLRRPDQRPVLLNFGPIHFHAGDEWRTIFSVLRATNRPAFFTLDHRVEGADGAFAWPPMHLSRSHGHVLSATSLESYLAAFEQEARTWPAFISTAFPRFHDFYAQGGSEPTLGYLDAADGQTLRATLSRALTNHSCLVQLATWNDFGEGTILEPTTAGGSRDLEMVQDLRRQYLDPRFAFHRQDLRLATRLYHLRQSHPTRAGASADLDRVFRLIVAGDLKAADTALGVLETRAATGAEPSLERSSRPPPNHRP